MEEVHSNTVFNDHFDKFMLSIKEELYIRFVDFIKQDETRTVIEPSVAKKSRGRPKKNESNEGKIIDEPKKKRGRPKKIKVEEQLLITAVDDSDVEKNNEQKARGRPVSEDRTIDRIVYNNETTETNDDNVVDSEEIDVVRIELNGNIYLRDGNNKLYNMSNQEYVGIYDELNEDILV
jgi:hypothetical protein